MAYVFNPFTGNFDVLGANQTLSNLQSPTAINQDLLPATDAGSSIGSASLTFLNIFTQTLTADSIQNLGSNPVINLAAYTLLDNTGSTLINFSNPTGATTLTQAALDNSTKIATTAYVDSAIGNLPNPIVYKGTWSAATNTPTLSNSQTGVEGYLYQVSAPGTVDFGAGPISFEIGDKVVNNGSEWQKWDMTDSVISVNGQNGIVVLDTDDISEGATNLYFTTLRARTAAVQDQIVNGVTDIAPSQNAVFDALQTLQPAGNYITALTGDGTATGPGSVAFTLATVNGNVGTFGSATQVGTFTVNAKGLITAASNTSIQIAQSQVTGLSTSLAGKANTSLNNIVNTAIPDDLLPDTDNLYDLGSTSLRWGTLFSSANTSTTNNVNVTNIRTAAGVNVGLLTGTSATLPSGGTATIRMSTVTLNNTVGINTVSDATANATQTGIVYIETGNKTAGTGNSGSIRLQTGTSTGGTRGEIFLSGSQVNVNSTKIVNLATPTANNDAANKTYVDTNAANTTLGNLGTTAINADLIPISTNTRTQGSAARVWARIYANILSSASGDQIDIANRALQFNGASVASWFNNGFQLLTSKILRFTDSGGTNTVGLQPPTTLAASIDYTLPSAAPTVNGALLSSTTAGVMSWNNNITPTVQKFTSGSGTYTTPAGVKWIRVTMVGAGGGGAGAGATGANGGTGGTTSFGTSLLSAPGGVGGNFNGSGGAGGAPTINLPAIALEAVPGSYGNAAGTINSAAVAISGGGGASMLGGAGGSVFNAAGISGGANSGGGASGGGGSGTNSSGGGGGAGAGLRAIIAAPSATYAFAIGTGGASGGGGAQNGGTGGDGVIIVEEFY